MAKPRRIVAKRKGENPKLNRLLDVLEKKGVSQYRLHKDSGISYSLINSYCSNSRQPGLDQLFRISKTLGVKVCDLVNE